MDPFTIALISVVRLLLLIWLGMPVASVLALVSFIGVWFIRSFDAAVLHLWSSASQTVGDSVFAVVPLYVLMGVLAGVAGMGRDTYDLAQRLIGKVRGSLGIATVFANAIFAAVTGVSVASAAIFAKLSVPEMMRHGYRASFAVGVVAGSSILGMLLPPSVLMIVYGIIAEQSIGDLFIAGIGPGLLMVAAFSALILGLAYLYPKLIYANPEATLAPHLPGGPGSAVAASSGAAQGMPAQAMAASLGVEPAPASAPSPSIWSQLLPIVALVGAVMGGIYAGIFTPIEAAAVGALLALTIAVLRRTLTLARLHEALMETGTVTAVVLFMIVGASMYSKMLGVSGLPTEIGEGIARLNTSFGWLMAIYVAIVLLLGTLIDSVSIMLIMVPLFMVILAPYEIDMIWFGIVTIIAAEIGLLTPPFGLSVFVVHSTLARKDSPLRAVFGGSAIFALTMFVVLLLVIAFPWIATGLVDIRR